MWFLKLLSKLPLSILYVLAFKLYIITYYIVGYRKKVVTENLINAFPEKSPKEIKKLRKKFYKHFTMVLVELIRSISMPKEEMQRRVTIKNRELVESYFAQGQSIVIITGHIGNWEWIQAGWSVHFDYPIDAVYKKLTNSKFDKLMYQLRSQFGGRPIEMNDTGKRILKRDKNSVEVFGFVADQIPHKSSINFWTDFLNQETTFYTGAERLSKVSGLPVVYGDMRRVKKGYYELAILPIAEPPYKNSKGTEITTRYAQLLEQTIQNKPSDWLWSHRRWKHKRSDVEKQ